MSRLFRFRETFERDPSIELWFEDQSDELGRMARHWFQVIRSCGEDVREVLHDGHPTACVRDAAFAYVNAFKAHVNVGFFLGAQMEDPADLLEGTGKYMRHVKLRPGSEVDEEALTSLVENAYRDMRRLVDEPARG
jgi:hypothetical protein